VVLDESTNETWLFDRISFAGSQSGLLFLFYFINFLGFFPQFSYIENFVFPAPK
jgi:hypothetical protein